MSYALVRSTAVKTHYHAGIRSSSSRPNIKEEKMVWLRENIASYDRQNSPLLVLGPFSIKNL